MIDFLTKEEFVLDGKEWIDNKCNGLWIIIKNEIKIRIKAEKIGKNIVWYSIKIYIEDSDYLLEIDTEMSLKSLIQNLKERIDKYN